MIVLSKYTPSAAHRAHIRATGFDIDDVDRRHPTQNPVAEKILAARAQTRDWRANALLNGRALLSRLMGRSRSLVLASLLVGAAAPAVADTEVPGVPDPIAAPGFSQLKREPSKAPITAPNFEPDQIDAIRPLPPAPMPDEPPIIVLIQAPDTKVLSAALAATIAFSVLILILLGLPLWRLWRLAYGQETPHPRGLAFTPTATLPPSSWITCGASRMGKIRSENQDAFRVLDQAPFPSLILCDGAGGLPGGKEAAETAADVITETLKAAPAGRHAVENVIGAARKHFDDKAIEGVTTAIVAQFDGDTLHYATLGDGGLAVIWPDGMISDVLAPHHALGRPANILTAWLGAGSSQPPRVGSLRLEPGCFVLAMSDGAADLMPLDSIAESRAAYGALLRGGAPSLADKLLKRIEEARDEDTGAYLHSDNMTLLMAHWPLEEADDAQ